MKLSCKDLDPEIDCGFEAMGNSTKEVGRKMLKHLRESHPEKLESMGKSDADILKMLESKVHA